MSSATSTSRGRGAERAALHGDLGHGDPKRVVLQDAGLQPWQFFVLAGLGCATAVTFIARGQGITTVLLLGVMMATATLVGLAVLRAVRPLVSVHDDRTAMVGQRTRAALEREKLLTLRAIKELEFDRAMGKLSEHDWQEMSGRLRVRAAGLIRQLDAGAGYREQIERDLAVRMARMSPPAGSKPSTDRDDLRSATASASAHAAADTTTGRHCESCSTINDADAKFCKACGSKL